MGNQAHRIGACILLVFILGHLGVHLTALLGISAHQSSLTLVQSVYRNPVGETLLVLVIVMQIISGAAKLKRTGRSGQSGLSGWALVQVISGAYLLFFLTVHTSAAVYTHTLFGLETDFYWAAGSLHFAPIKYAFAVYYFLAILAFFSHLAAACHYIFPTFGVLAKALPVVGAAIGALIIAPFSGALYEIEIPENVEDYYERYFPLDP